MEQEKIQVKVKNKLGEIFYVVGPNLKEYGYMNCDYRYYIYSKDYRNPTNNNPLEIVDCIYCWFHNYAYYKPLLRKIFGNYFTKLEELRKEFIIQNNKRFRILWVMADDYGGYESSAIIVCYDNKQNHYIHFKVVDNEYRVCKIDYNEVIKKDEFDVINYKDNLLLEGRGDIHNENTEYQCLLTLSTFLIKNNDCYMIDGRTTSNFRRIRIGKKNWDSSNLLKIIDE